METENAQWLDRRSGSALDTITGPAVTSSHITIRSLLLESATSEEPSCGSAIKPAIVAIPDIRRSPSAAEIWLPLGSFSDNSSNGKDPYGSDLHSGYWYL